MMLVVHLLDRVDVLTVNKQLGSRWSDHCGKRKNNNKGYEGLYNIVKAKDTMGVHGICCML